jgi:RNA polymerase sigma factor (sigma-70 family)
VAIRSNAAVLRQIQTLFDVGVISDRSDAQLLERFTTLDREAAEPAFAALVERHGPMVLRVCRSLLKNSDDAEDACQATFFVLVQRARYVWVRDSLAPWLHRVAHRVASRARASSFRRREHERRAAELRLRVVYDGVDSEGLAGLLHKEIDRLPERYRAAVVVCDLEGLSHEKAARQLGWPVGTVKSRLARARQILRSRLTARGLTAPAVLGLMEAATNSVDAAVSLRVVESALRAAVLVAKAPTIEVISVSVANLAEEVLQTMFLTKVKVTWAAVLIACALATGTAAVLGRQSDGSKPAAAADRPGAKRADITRPAPENGATEAPAFIRQSRSMIITRLEQELAQAKARLDRTLRRVGSPNDPAAVQGRKTVDEIAELLARIDGVLVDAVDRFPTMFDFSGGQGDLGSGSTSPNLGAAKSKNVNDVYEYGSNNYSDGQKPNRTDRAGSQDGNTYGLENHDWWTFPGQGDWQKSQPKWDDWSKNSRQGQAASQNGSSSGGENKGGAQQQGNAQNSQSKSGDWQKNNSQGQAASQSGSSSGSANKESAQGQNNAPSADGEPGTSQTDNRKGGQQSSGKPQNQQNANPQGGKQGQRQDSSQNQQQGSGRSQQPDSSQTQQQGAHDIGTEGYDNAGPRKATGVSGDADVEVTVLGQKRVVEIGNQITFQIRLRNYGNEAANHLRVSTELSRNLEFLKSSGVAKETEVNLHPQGTKVLFEQIDRLGPRKELFLYVLARVTGPEPKLANCRVFVNHDDLPDSEQLEDVSGIKVTPASGN